MISVVPKIHWTPIYTLNISTNLECMISVVLLFGLLTIYRPCKYDLCSAQARPSGLLLFINLAYMAHQSKLCVKAPQSTNPLQKSKKTHWRQGMLRNVYSNWNISNNYLCKYVSTSSTRVVEKFVVCGRHLRKTFRRCLRLSDGSDFLISSHSHVTPRPFPYLSPFIGHRSPSLWISRYLSILDFCPNHSRISISTDTELRSLLLGRFSAGLRSDLTQTL